MEAKAEKLKEKPAVIEKIVTVEVPAPPPVEVTELPPTTTEVQMYFSN